MVYSQKCETRGKWRLCNHGFGATSHAPYTKYVATTLLIVDMNKTARIHFPAGYPYRKACVVLVQIHG